MKPNVYLVIVVLMALGACASQSVRAVDRLSGGELFQRMCASCHGAQAKGDGPAAPALKTRVADLTRLARREGGEFPAEDIRRTIDGRFERSAHGSRDMPVWGWRWYDTTSRDAKTERARVDAAVDRLVEYLRALQVE